MFDLRKVFAHNDARSTVGVLAWLDNPNVLQRCSSICGPFSFLLCLNGLKGLLKSIKLDIIQPIIDHISEWKDDKGVLPFSSVEVSHVEKEVLLIAETLVRMHLIIDPYHRSLLLKCFLFLRVLPISDIRGNQGFPLKFWEGFDVPLFEPLSPDKVALLKGLLLILDPPCARFEYCFDKQVIVSHSYEVLILALTLIEGHKLISDPIELIEVPLEGYYHALFC